MIYSTPGWACLSTVGTVAAITSVFLKADHLSSIYGSPQLRQLRFLLIVLMTMKYDITCADVIKIITVTSQIRVCSEIIVRSL